MPNLYIVATPIGNIGDVTLRAMKVLKDVGLIAAEDTRRTARLLAACSIDTPMTSYYEQNKRSKLRYLLRQLQTIDVALVSDAGTPGISDPGFELINAAIDNGIAVVPVPGPSVLVTSVVVSGLPTHEFTYLGFMPRKKAQRISFLERVADQPRTLVMFESPHRIRAALRDVLKVLGDRRIAVCREMTKLYEEVFRGTVTGAIDYFAEPRGEFTLVIEGKIGEEPPSIASVEEELLRLRSEGLSGKDAVAQVAKSTGLPKKEVYRMWLGLG
ncbi:MAG: 16S rRNA (cytidine(1402)-2'-O)-methyltransferase [Chloroflexota bacterium]|nr:16S rRNA (cytidine(1402)-2'-O)-methyltransferase [Chloroflexota bacterium]